MFIKIDNIFSSKLFFVLLLVELISACESDLKFNGEQSKSLLVISSFVSPEDTVKVHVSLSKFFLSNSSYTDVDNAKVDLYLNGQYAATLTHISEGNYFTTTKAHPADVVRFKIESTKYGVASCESNVPILLDKSSIQSKCDNNFFYLSIMDDASTENYYRIVGKQKTEYYTYNLNKTKKMEMVWNMDLKLKNSIENDQLTQFGKTDSYPLYFSDKSFNGKMVTLKLESIGLFSEITYDSVSNVKSFVSTQDTLDYTILDSIRYDIDIQSITKDYYLFIKTSKLVEDKLYLLEPVQVKSNITGGIGILGAFSSLRVSKTWIPNEK
jgi:hypothetical protein